MHYNRFAITRINEINVYVCLCRNLLGTNRPEGWVRTDRKVGTKRPSLGTKDPWVRNDWIPEKQLQLSGQNGTKYYLLNTTMVY